jgi:hypothetical protein
MSSREVFTGIYKNHVWGLGTADSPLSGDGSTPDNARPYVDFVKFLLAKYKINSVLDFGHGDWAMGRDYDFSNVSYLGVDVADEISAKLMKSHGSENRRFMQVPEDIEVLPIADLVITKEVLQHLSNSEIIRILEAFRPFKHIVICNAYFQKRLIPIQVFNAVQFRTRLKKLLGGSSFMYPAQIYRNNRDIETGGFHGIDLERFPFSMAFPHHELVSCFSYSSRKNSGFVAKVYHFKKV